MDYNTIINDDCLHAMQGLEDNTIDSIVTDPPYGLSFMGKDWDHGIPGVVFWQEALRIAKPGCHLLAFGGTRTFHRLAVAIEDAGWEIRDTVMWVYGCLSDDTEILTDSGWKRYDAITCGSMVMCYNVGKDSLEFGKVEEVFTYEISDTAYRIQSDNTDQIVTKDHRCLVERGGEYVFQRAATLQREETVPVLESVPDVWETIQDGQPDAGNEKQVLRGRVRGAGNGESEQRGETRTAQARKSHLPSLREKVLETPIPCGETRQSDLQQALQRGFARGGMEAARAQGEGGLETRERGGACGTDDGRYEPGMEGRSDILQNTWELSGCEICEVSEGISGNGKERRVCDGTPPDCCAASGAMPETLRGSTPHRPRPNEQQPRQSNAIQEQQPAQEIRSAGATVPTLATVTQIHYDGTVWCVRVPTGAFVARRNGHIFVTGNSGFPKSLDVSKAIDKAAGAEREVVAERTMTQGGGSSLQIRMGERREVEANITAPATDAAKQWAGYGTALKPAWEPVIVARKPIDGTVANNVLKWGTGALNIDGCRVGTETKLNGPIQHIGRFPANLIHDGSDEVVSGFPNDTSRFFYCAKASKSERNMGCEGLPLPDDNLQGLDTRGRTLVREDGSKTLVERWKGTPRQNNHPTVKPLALMRYLCRLVTPPDGVVLDPFCGSGSTLVGALQEGFRYIGIEKDPDYVNIAYARTKHALKEWGRKSRQQVLQEVVS